MSLDPRTLAAAFVLLSAVLSVLLLLAWIQNRKVRALAWWSATFGLIPLGISMANLGADAPNPLNLLVANAAITLGYGALYAGCLAFNGRVVTIRTVALGSAVWVAAFPFIHEFLGARITVLALISGAYAALSGWELSRHAPQRLASQRAAVILLYGLAVFNLLRAVLGLPLGSLFGMNIAVSRWSAELALFLVVYAPALAFSFLSMAKERLECEHRKAEQALRESEEHYRYSVEFNPQIPWTANPQGDVLHMSPRWCNLTGMPPEEALGQGWIRALHPDDVPTVAQHWLDAVASRRSVDIEYRLCLAEAGYRWFRVRATPRLDEHGAVVRWYGTVEDIHDRKRAEKQLHWAAYHDDLSGLPNRRFFVERLRAALDDTLDRSRRVGLLILDLDYLKHINDQFGHDAGDALLKEFGQRLRRIVRAADTVARLSGDEFAVVLSDVAGEESVAAVAQAILVQMQEPLTHNGKTLDCRTSIGGAISGEHSLSAEELLKQADLALYSCKATARSTFAMFKPIMRDEAQKTASALEIARRALEHDWIEPFYQPKVELGSGRLAGFEALLRWRHPRMGIQSPDTLAPAFDDMELGLALGARMLACVVRDMRRWVDAGLDIGRVSINASSAEFRRDDYAQRVLAHLREAGIPPNRFGVEVTETVFLDHNVEHAQKTLRALSEGGVSIALDDFGTGYASLSHLKLFPVNVLKIDRSFVDGLETDTDDAAIVKAVLSLGQSLDIRVVAEGVETAAQASFLREHGCDMGQGYHFGRPMPAGGIVHFMTSRALDAGGDNNGERGEAHSPMKAPST
ncbi:putative bifunctional diguanylate cyclase/phosphodiesterase [Microvirga calopogonii]|uniref:putative bifunctional diguanylate cyclase/phosphodiesterase n=1 Tax=Microvirga calopogonii TaxID=2078013 RepID=UPI000E0D1779|nr:EAL domain-containing protein [Microvirga calopogonii]